MVKYSKLVESVPFTVGGPPLIKNQHINNVFTLSTSSNLLTVPAIPSLMYTMVSVNRPAIAPSAIVSNGHDFFKYNSTLT